MALSIPEDHPVRKLFQRFKQQRDSQTLDQNCVLVEPEHHPHTDSNSCHRRQSGSSQQEHNNKPSTGRGSVSGVPQHVFTDAGKSEQSCAQVTVESKSRPCAEDQICQRGSGGAEGAAGPVNSAKSLKGWAKFRSAVSAEPPLPAVEPEKQTLSEERVAAKKNQDSEESGQLGGNATGEAGDETSVLHKTDSCDSGITKSDLRIDRAGESRSSFERSPMEKSPLERSPLEHTLGVYTEVSMRPSFLQPVAEQSLLQATLQEAKLELKGDIRKLSSRLSLLESQVSEILRLLSTKRRLSLPLTPSKPRIKRHDLGSASRLVAPKAEEETFEFTYE